MTETFSLVPSEPPGAPDRRGLLRCMVWAGAGVLWTVAGGVPRSRLIGSAEATTPGADLSFVQISDSHIGFTGAPNMDVSGTLREAVEMISQIKGNASLMLHTGDVSQTAKPGQFDTAMQIIAGAGLDTHFVPGEHDVQGDGGTSFYQRFTPGAARGWYSWDQQGVHFVALNNVQYFKPETLGHLGPEQLGWLKSDLAARASSTPVVVIAHVPLWTVSEQWGWGTDDGLQALGLLRRFGSVTVLNGHIHQIMQKIEGQVSFHTARSTAFPQPAPGTAANPGPIRNLPPGRLQSTLGITQVARVVGRSGLAIVDTPLGA